MRFHGWEKGLRAVFVFIYVAGFQPAMVKRMETQASVASLLDLGWYMAGALPLDGIR